MSSIPLELTADGKVTGPRGAKITKRWVPKEWRPEYEAMVALSCTGLNNEEVGRRFGYGKQQVSNILNTPQAKIVRDLIKQKLNDSITTNIKDRIALMQEKALVHVEHVLDRPTEDFKNPLAIFDRSLKFLKSTSAGEFKQDEPVQGNTTNFVMNNIDKAMILTPNNSSLLAEGLKKANEVKAIHDGSIGHINAGSGKSDG